MAHLVCVIDDDCDVCDLIRLTLETRGLRVEAANDGESGFCLVQKFRPDLVILDILMPGMNGYDVLARIRSTPEIQDTPVFLVTSITAGGEITDSEWRDKIEVADFLTKPFDPMDLLARVKKHLGLDA